MRGLQVPPVVPYKALEKFSKALYGTTGGTYSARVFRPVMSYRNDFRWIQGPSGQQPRSCGHPVLNKVHPFTHMSRATSWERKTVRHVSGQRRNKF